MTKNVGLFDRMIRLLVGGVLIGWALLYPEMPYSYLGWIGVIIAATGLVGWCGLYALIGFKTRS